MMIPEISIIILCYKAGYYSEKYLMKVLSVLKKNEIFDYEIILVGNYVPNSNDNTPNIVNSLSETHKSVYALTEPKPKHGWLGWDVRKAVEKSRGKFIALIDGDGQMPADDLAVCFINSKEKQADITMTYRIKRGDGLYRRTLSYSYNLFVRLLFPTFRIKDLNSKPKIIKRTLIDDLKLSSNGWTIDAEIMLQALKRKVSISEIPTCFLGQPGGRKSFVGYKAIIEFVIFIIKQRVFGIK